MISNTVIIIIDPNQPEEMAVLVSPLNNSQLCPASTSLGCIFGSVGSSGFGTWSVLETESQDISASVESILIEFFLNLSLEMPSTGWKCNTKLLEYCIRTGHYHFWIILFTTFICAYYLSCGQEFLTVLYRNIPLFSCLWNIICQRC